MEFISRLKDFVQSGGGLGGAMLALGFFALVGMGLVRKRWWLISIFVGALMFAGYDVPAIDAGSVLVRWLVMFVLALTCVHGMKSPGLGAILMTGVAVMGIMTAPIAPNAMWAIQFSGLFFILTFPMAAAIADELRTMLDVTRILKILLVGAGIWVCLQAAALPGLAVGRRFTGAGETSGAFAFTGGLMLPVTLWGVLSGGSKSWKLYSAVTGTLILLLILLSGSRTGTFSGLIACMPLILARFGIKKVALGFVLIAMGLGLVWGVVSYMPKHKEFLLDRYISTDTTGRVERWEMALEEALDSPFVGQGVGGEIVASGVAPHNVYLVIWLTHGAVGLLLFLGGMIVMLVHAVTLMGKRTGSQAKDVGRLFAGIMLGSMAAGFFVAKTNSPSNVIAFFIILTSVVVQRTRVISKKLRSTVDTFDHFIETSRSEYHFGELLRQYYGS